MPKWYGKLDWNITNSNILEVTGASNREETQGSIYSYNYNTLRSGDFINYADTIKTGGDLYTAKFTSYITDNLTLTATYGKMRNDNYDSPGGYDGSLTYLSATSKTKSGAERRRADRQQPGDIHAIQLQSP